MLAALVSTNFSASGRSGICTRRRVGVTVSLTAPDEEIGNVVPKIRITDESAHERRRPMAPHPTAMN